MALQGVILSWSGVVADDEGLHLEAINRLLVEENLRPWDLNQKELYRLQYLGQPDRERLRSLWGDQGRVLNPKQLKDLVERKVLYYQQALETQTQLPLIPRLVETLEKLGRLQLPVGLICGQSAAEVNYVLGRCPLEHYFSSVVTGDEGDPLESPGYLHRLLLERMGLQAGECLSIEATYPGIRAARSAGIPTLAVATLLPLHMLQRRANWVVDGYNQIEWDRLQNWFATGQDRPPVLAEREGSLPS
ncbi:HAD family phosphatase [Synechococcus sp. Nb3U1]|uniref:HAD family hydrolase n=1 Tax=Synechococcus sp. Nb3U1 TaxID=1914529 RepID=UPI001F3D4FF8|nr:HAD family phosphatase [Synechococcus sp. Nb3U1]MCF2972014.1 HAD family phosphatase [Synechococcus sp. Nb3U1]